MGLDMIFQERHRRYVPKEECEVLCEANENVDHPNVSIPHG
jgi:hypothetical protein